MSTIPTKQIDGDVAIGRTVTAGGNATVRGNVVVGHNLKVEGWLDARNIKGPCKGLFLTEGELEAAYPHPQRGWWGLVGETTPADVYVAVSDGGAAAHWVATGAKGGEDTAATASNAALIEKNWEAIQQNAGEITRNAEEIAETKNRLSTCETSVTKVSQTLTALTEKVAEVEEAEREAEEKIELNSQSIDAAVKYIAGIENRVDDIDFENTGRDDRISNLEGWSQEFVEVLADVSVEAGGDYVSVKKRFKTIHNQGTRPDVEEEIPMAMAPYRNDEGQAGVISAEDKAGLDKAAAVADRLDGKHVVSEVSFEANATQVSYKAPRFRPDGGTDTVGEGGILPGGGIGVEEGVVAIEGPRSFPMASDSNAGAITAEFYSRLARMPTSEEIEQFRQEIAAAGGGEALTASEMAEIFDRVYTEAELSQPE